MRVALALAARALERETSPNPRVGAVVVKDGRVVGEGFHVRAGAPHAEAVALWRAGRQARGATLYATLEPCTHQGRTPPCAGAIVEAGIRRVVAAMRDPNPRVSGRGLEWLAQRGVDTATGCLEEEARRLNPFFLAWATRNRPYVTLKYAMTLDGKLACASRESRWITGAVARSTVHRERARHDAILVGIGTVLADDPRLTARVEAEEEWHPLRVVLDSLARTPPTAALLRCGGPPPLIVVGPEAPEHRRRRLEEGGASVRQVARSHQGHLCLPSLLRLLHARPVTSLLVEGGANVQASFLDLDLFDRLLAFLAPRVVGGSTAPRPAGGRQGEASLSPPHLHAVREWDGDLGLEMVKGGLQARG